MAALVAGLVGASALAACDAGTFRIDPATQPAFPLEMLSSNVGENKPMPADGAIQIAFSRYLMPSNVTRQAFVLNAVGGQAVPPPLVTYDPVARIVTIQNPAKGQPWLLQDQVYRLEMNPDLVVAIDGGKLSGTTSMTFRIGPPAGTPFEEPTVSLCSDILPIFTAKCLGGGCHSGSTAASSLVLDSSKGIVATAIGRVAQGANTGGRAAPSAAASGRVFGVDMPLVSPGNPASSWLLYKTIMAPLPTTTPSVSNYVCTKPGGPKVSRYEPITPYSPAPTEQEQNVLRDYVLGREMPFPVAQPTLYEEIPLTFHERELIRLWIAQGANAPDCGGCGVVNPVSTDAGTGDASSDAAPTDAASD